MIIGENIGVLPFKGLNKISDLIFYDGPILSHFKDKYGKDIIFYWVDFNNNYNRWLIFQVSEKNLYSYLLNHASLQQLFDSVENDVFYTAEIGHDFNYENIHIIYKEDLNDKYYPEINSYFKSELPEVYNSPLLKKYEENYLIELLSETAAYIKAEPKSDSANWGLLGLSQGSSLLNGCGEALKGLISYKVRQRFIEKSIVVEKRINAAIKNVIDILQGNIVKAQISSFAVGFSPNFINEPEEKILDIEWRKELFETFKNDLLEIDTKDSNEIDELVNSYSDDNKRFDMYKPIIDLYNNDKLVIQITDHNFKVIRTIKSIQEDKVEKLLHKTSKPAKKDLLNDRLAIVKVDEQNRVSKKKADLNLLEHSILTAHKIEEVRSYRASYILNKPMLLEYEIHEGIHRLTSYDLVIDAYGDGVLNCERDFYEKFDGKYVSCFIKSDGKLTMMVDNDLSKLFTLLVKKVILNEQ